MNAHSISPLVLGRLIGERWPLIVDLTKRDALGRYKGSWLGVLWSLVTPILMLLVYTFVFSTVFNVRWGTGTQSKMEFALILFSGLITFGIFSECVTKAPQLIVGNANLVKKVLFPLEVLPVVALLSSLIHATIASAILLAFQAAFAGRLPIEVLLLPVVIAPHCLFVLGITWFISALAVYVRDVGQAVGVVVSALLFLSPIFFPSSALPEGWRWLLVLNPLATPVEHVRGLLIWGHIPVAEEFVKSAALGLITAWVGFAWFQKSRKGFADVL